MIQEIIDNINDICLELNDVGIFTSNRNYPHWCDYRMDIHKFIDDDPFHSRSFMRYDDIKDVIDRLTHYMHDNGYRLHIDMNYIPYPGVRFPYIKKIINKYKGKVYYISIDFIDMDYKPTELISWDIIPESGFGNNRPVFVG